ncbi:hypothetical protein HYH03_003312 [Edaphochlamys debaryana]|uniref:Uncharacterized protein n=1 Tax=Edaphochlamys debaryana TaxID=47281 RepID=A0A835YCY9_9CHLO|nr:hypothetical protein HYH03_003312 [Edaphochlamys debaryana]|eukprot:KAG2498561.1 hypothetical protein HYH03_003312 [Edaphochlamys debaryana]
MAPGHPAHNMNLDPDSGKRKPEAHEVLRYAREKHGESMQYVLQHALKNAPNRVGMARLQFGDGEYSAAVASMQMLSSSAASRRPEPLPEVQEPVPLTRTLSRTPSMSGARARSARSNAGAAYSDNSSDDDADGSGSEEDSEAAQRRHLIRRLSSISAAAAAAALGTYGGGGGTGSSRRSTRTGDDEARRASVMGGGGGGGDDGLGTGDGAGDGDVYMSLHRPRLGLGSRPASLSGLPPAASLLDGPGPPPVRNSISGTAACGAGPVFPRVSISNAPPSAGGLAGSPTGSAAASPYSSGAVKRVSLKGNAMIGAVGVDGATERADRLLRCLRNQGTPPTAGTTGSESDGMGLIGTGFTPYAPYGNGALDTEIGSSSSSSAIARALSGRSLRLMTQFPARLSNGGGLQLPDIGRSASPKLGAESGVNPGSPPPPGLVRARSFRSGARARVDWVDGADGDVNASASAAGGAGGSPLIRNSLSATTTAATGGPGSPGLVGLALSPLSQQAGGGSPCGTAPASVRANSFTGLRSHRRSVEMPVAQGPPSPSPSNSSPGGASPSSPFATTAAASRLSLAPHRVSSRHALMSDTGVRPGGADSELDAAAAASSIGGGAAAAAAALHSRPGSLRSLSGAVAARSVSFSGVSDVIQQQGVEVDRVGEGTEDVAPPAPTALPVLPPSRLASANVRARSCVP